MGSLVLVWLWGVVLWFVVCFLVYFSMLLAIILIELSNNGLLQHSFMTATVIMTSAALFKKKRRMTAERVRDIVGQQLEIRYSNAN